MGELLVENGMYKGSNEEKADSAIAYLEAMKEKHKGNYGVETSVDNRVAPIRGYKKRKDWAALERFYKEQEDDYLAGWKYP